jgi:hypothetical protein
MVRVCVWHALRGGREAGQMGEGGGKGSIERGGQIVPEQGTGGTGQMNELGVRGGMGGGLSGASLGWV